MIHIDRSKRTEAWNKVAEQGRRLMAQRQLGDHVSRRHAHAARLAGHYKAGATRLAVATGAPVVPIAVTSARCWPRKSFVLRPGVIDVSIGKPIPSAGREPDELMREVEAWIEAEMRRLDPEAYAGCLESPAHAAPPPSSPAAACSSDGPRRRRRSAAGAACRAAAAATRPAPLPRPQPAAFRHPRASREVRLTATSWPTSCAGRGAGRIGFVVGAEGLVVSAPRWVGLAEIDAALQREGGLDPAQAAGAARARAPAGGGAHRVARRRHASLSWARR